MGVQAWDSVIAGASGGFVASIATCPLDVIKTKLQAQHASKGQAGYQGIRATCAFILQHHGYRGFYRGLGPTLLGYLPSWGIYFLVYDSIKNNWGNRPAEQRGHFFPAAQVKGYQPVKREHPWSLHILSAMVAGTASTLATNPLWVIKTRFMTQSVEDVKYRHTWDACKTIYQHEGISAFYRGLGPSLLGIIHVAIQFPLYENLKIWVQPDPDIPLTTWDILGCSSLAKMVASIATYPHEVVRTRFQTLRRPLASTTSSDGMVKTIPRVGIIGTAKHIIMKEGYLGLYKGLSVNLVRTVPNSVITLWTYECVKFMLAEYHNRVTD